VKIYVTRFGSLITKEWGVPSLRDISYGLANIIRYNGSSRKLISVAAHSIFVYELATYFKEPLNIRLHCLLHDAAECVIGDIPSAFKVPEIITIENQVLDRILVSMGLTSPNQSEAIVIKKYDYEALCIEIHHLDGGGEGNKDLVHRPILEYPFDLISKFNERLQTFTNWDEEYEVLARQLLKEFHV